LCLLIMGLASLLCSGCLHYHNPAHPSAKAYEDPKDQLHFIASTGKFDLYFADTVFCGGPGTIVPVAIKNTTSEPLELDPDDAYLDAGGERSYHLTHANTEVSGEGHWVANVLKKQTIEPGVMVRGYLAFPLCIDQHESVTLHFMGQELAMTRGTHFMWYLIVLPVGLVAVPIVVVLLLV
jgi:hypothetical protein